MSTAEQQARYRKTHRKQTHDNCSICQKEKMNWAKLCVSCTRKKDVNEKNCNWKGNDVGYRALHRWIEQKLGKPNFCEDCRNGKLKPRQYQWANISHKYKRDLNDYKRLCAKCHAKFDKKYRTGRPKIIKLIESPK